MAGHPDVPAVRCPSLAQPVPGTILAGHRVEAMVGRGGMGVVYRARHCRLGRVAALKVIAPELAGDASVQRRFLEEAVAAASFEHPNVVPVYDAGESHGIPYLAMHYVHGMDLCAMVGRLGPLAPARAAEIVAGVGAALDAMHRAGYVHRDVKPRNVLIAGGGSCRCAHSRASRFSRVNGGRPVRAKWSRQPSAYTSVRASVRPPRICSGAA